MENKDLERLPDPNTYNGDAYHLVNTDSIKFGWKVTIYYRHEFIDGNGNITKHWSKKPLLPNDATLDDL